jgi:hypothetical protein
MQVQATFSSHLGSITDSNAADAPEALVFSDILHSGIPGQRDAQYLEVTDQVECRRALLAALHGCNRECPALSLYGSTMSLAPAICFHLGPHKQALLTLHM